MQCVLYNIVKCLLGFLEAFIVRDKSIQSKQRIERKIYPICMLAIFCFAIVANNTVVYGVQPQAGVQPPPPPPPPPPPLAGPPVDPLKVLKDKLKLQGGATAPQQEAVVQGMDAVLQQIQKGGVKLKKAGARVLAPQAALQGMDAILQNIKQRGQQGGGFGLKPAQQRQLAPPPQVQLQGMAAVVQQVNQGGVRLRKVPQNQRPQPQPIQPQLQPQPQRGLAQRVAGMLHGQQQPPPQQAQQMQQLQQQLLLQQQQNQALQQQVQAIQQQLQQQQAQQQQVLQQQVQQQLQQQVALLQQQLQQQQQLNQHLQQQAQQQPQQQVLQQQVQQQQQLNQHFQEHIADIQGQMDQEPMTVNTEAQEASTSAAQQALESASVHTDSAMSGLVHNTSTGSMSLNRGMGNSFTNGSKNTSMKGSTGFIARVTPSRQMHPLLKKAARLQTLDVPFVPEMPYRLFVAAVGSRKDESRDKGIGGQVGFIMNPLVEELRVGVSYSYLYNDIKEYIGTDTTTAFGAMKAKTATNVASAVVAWNVDKPGIMAHFVGSYGWGDIKTSRTFTHGDQVLTAKGNPKINMYGAGAQIGYNIALSDKKILTPYLELQSVYSGWGSFKEHQGPIKAKLGKLKQKSYEETLGLRHRWRLSEMFELQSWGAYVASQKKINSLKSTIQGHAKNANKYELAKKKQKTSEVELGLSLNMYLTDNLGTGINGSIRTKNIKSLTRENIGLSLWYDF